MGIFLLNYKWMHILVLKPAQGRSSILLGSVQNSLSIIVVHTELSRPPLAPQLLGNTRHKKQKQSLYHHPEHKSIVTNDPVLSRCCSWPSPRPYGVKFGLSSFVLCYCIKTNFVITPGAGVFIHTC